MGRGLFITLEGIDGAGKSTQQRLLVRHLQGLGYPAFATREPGGTPIGEQIRSMLMGHQSRNARGLGNKNRAAEASTLGRHNDTTLTPLAELVLMYAARAQHIEQVVRPALTQGQLVVSDRFNDASLAYQGYGRNLGVETVHRLDGIVCGRTQPDLTLLLDLDPRRALARAKGRNSGRSRFEAEGLKFQQRVRAGYLAIARKEPRRVKLVRADRPVADVQAEIRRIVERFLPRRRPQKAASSRHKV